MNDASQIATVDEACTVLSHWFGWRADLAGAPIALPFAVPQSIEIVNRRLGRLWQNTAAGGGIDIFNCQDRLIAPHRYQVGSDGIVPIIRENQDVWACGFKPDAGLQLWVTGDWPSGQSDVRAWRTSREIIDTAVIFVLLSNAVWASPDCEMDQEHEKPVEADRLLWAFSPWPGLHGFWTNGAKTLIRMQGTDWGVTARR